MKQQRRAAGKPSDWVQETADFLITDYPESICLVTGLMARPGKGEAVKQLDLLAVTGGAIFIGVEWRGQRANGLDPQTAVQLVVTHVRTNRLASQPIPVYVFWLDQSGDAPVSADTPLMGSATAVIDFIELVSQNLPAMPDRAITNLFDGLLTLGVSPPRQLTPTPPLRRALRRMGDLPGKFDQSLQDFIRQPLSPGGRQIQPADVNRHLERALFNRDNQLEDANYQKIAPNDYLIELDPENFKRHYLPILKELRQGWRTQLLEALATANNRAGRKEYRFGGPVRVRVKPSSEVQPGQVQIACRINPETSEAAGAGETAGSTDACLESPRDGRRYPLRPGVTTMGRDAACDIYLDDPTVQAKRLISGQHAYILAERGEYLLFDGASSGKASTNGTFVNGRRLTSEGYALSDGCQIILASLDANKPSPDAPGAAVFIFRQECAEGR